MLAPGSLIRNNFASLDTPKYGYLHSSELTVVAVAVEL